MTAASLLPASAATWGLTRGAQAVRSRRAACAPPILIRRLGRISAERDVLLEAIDDAPAGGVLVLEAATAGLAAVVIWGRHRDTAELRRIGLPVHSLGAHPSGPRRLPPAGPAMRVALLDGVPVPAGALVVGDDDGLLVVPAAEPDPVLGLALRIQATEAAQARRMAAGESLRAQLDFAGYRRRQREEPGYTLRRHLAERAARSRPEPPVRGGIGAPGAAPDRPPELVPRHGKAPEVPVATVVPTPAMVRSSLVPPAVLPSLRPRMRSAMRTGCAEVLARPHIPCTHSGWAPPLA